MQNNETCCPHPVCTVVDVREGEESGPRVHDPDIRAPADTVLREGDLRSVAWLGDDVRHFLPASDPAGTAPSAHWFYFYSETKQE